jgi:hypothetical protein
MTPPSDITPASFFHDWLPAQINGKIAGPTPPILCRVTLAGDGGGAWDLTLGASGLTAGPAGTGAADVSMSQSVADWRAFWLGEGTNAPLAPPQPESQATRLLDGRMLANVRQVKALFRFEIAGFEGRTWSLDLALGPVKPAPDATVTVDLATYRGLLDRSIPAPAAYFSGRIKIAGDMALAMQVAMTLAQRPS